MINKLKKKIGPDNFKRGKNFGKYIFIGIVWTLLNIFFMWLFIDIFRFPTLIGASLVVVGLFLGKFYAYIIIDLIHNKFIKYTSTVVSFSLANILLMWLFVDSLKIPTIISSTIIVCSLFILRFIAFGKTGLIKG